MANFTMQIGVDEIPSSLPLYNITDEESVMENLYGLNDVIRQLHIGVFLGTEAIGYVSCAYGCYPFVYDGLMFADAVEAYTDKYPWIREEFFIESESKDESKIAIDGGFVHVYAIHKTKEDSTVITRGQLLALIVKNLRKIADIVGPTHPWTELLTAKRPFVTMLLMDPAFAPKDQYTPMGELASDLEEDLATDPAKCKVEFIRIA